MSTSLGMGSGTLVGCRVSVPCVYIPAYQKNGQTINECLKIKAFVNGRNGKSHVFDMTAWGKLANVCAKSLSIGKEFHCEYEPESYDAKVYNNREVVLKADGTPLTVKKTSFRITRLVFGDESAKFIDTQIKAGVRPATWNDGGEGSKLWAGMLKGLHAKPYDGVADTYGYAKVLKVASTPATAEANPALTAAFGTMAENVKTAAGTDINPF